MLSDDPVCQAVFDERPVDAAELLPDVSALLALEHPMVLVVEGIGVADPEQALGRARAVLGCSRLGCTIDWPSARAGHGEEIPAWVASAVDVCVPGWKIVAYRAHPVSAEDARESGRAVVGRDRLVVEININGESVSEDLIQTVTTTALSRADAQVLREAQQRNRGEPGRAHRGLCRARRPAEGEPCCCLSGSDGAEDVSHLLLVEAAGLGDLEGLDTSHERRPHRRR
jgi:hypothetical protein